MLNVQITLFNLKCTYLYQMGEIWSPALLLTAKAEYQNVISKRLLIFCLNNINGICRSVNTSTSDLNLFLCMMNDITPKCQVVLLWTLRDQQLLKSNTSHCEQSPCKYAAELPQERSKTLRDYAHTYLHLHKKVQKWTYQILTVVFCLAGGTTSFAF